MDRFETFDLLEDGNNVFKANFDWFTPRPHFIVKIKPEFHEIMPAYKQDQELSVYSSAQADFFDQLFNSAGQVTDKLKRFGLDPKGPERGEPVTLSIHRGQWVSPNSPEFHAHICTDVQTYRRAYRLMVESGRLPKTFPKKFVTKAWRKVKKPTDTAYEANVRGYPYDRYFEKDVKLMKTTYNIPGVKTNQHGLLVHEKYARLGFEKTTSGTMPNLLMKMERFAINQQLSTCGTMRDQLNDHRGCHLCITLGSAFPGFGGRTDVFGYVKATGPAVYQMMPHDTARNQWFQQFIQSNERVLT